MFNSAIRMYCSILIVCMFTLLVVYFIIFFCRLVSTIALNLYALAPNQHLNYHFRCMDNLFGFQAAVLILQEYFLGHY